MSSSSAINFKNCRSNNIWKSLTKIVRSFAVNRLSFIWFMSFEVFNGEFIWINDLSIILFTKSPIFIYSTYFPKETGSDSTSICIDWNMKTIIWISLVSFAKAICRSSWFVTIAKNVEDAFSIGAANLLILSSLASFKTW